MKKQKGFTLSEVLITMGLLGVIVSLTLPVLKTNTNVAKVGPKLVKGASNFQQANKALLASKNADKLYDAGYFGESELDYGSDLSNFIDITQSIDDPEFYIGSDGIGYKWIIEGNPDETKAARKQLIGSVIIDINGTSGANESAIDQFWFSFWNDGSIRPYGGTNFDENNSEETHWKTLCPIGNIPTSPDHCAGHIFENNYKIEYTQ